MRHYCEETIPESAYGLERDTHKREQLAECLNKILMNLNKR